MPVYLYACEKCKDNKELVKDMNDPDPENCPDCGSNIKRIFSVGGIAFKGKGFYSTGG
jgi:putative FmdB family regulatory protein